MMYYEAKSNCNLREREEIVYISFHNLVIINQLLYIVYCYYFYSYELCPVISLLSIIYIEPSLARWYGNSIIYIEPSLARSYGKSSLIYIQLC